MCLVSLCSLLQFLWFFTCVSRGILPSTDLVKGADDCYMSLSFSFSSFSMFPHSVIKKSVFIFSFFSFLCSSLLSILSMLLFFSALLSVPCSVFSLCLFTLFSDLLYCYHLLSFLFSFPVALFCLLLAYVLLLFTLFYFCYSSILLCLILLCYLICSCFCFLHKNLVRI